MTQIYLVLYEDYRLGEKNSPNCLPISSYINKSDAIKDIHILKNLLNRARSIARLERILDNWDETHPLE